MSNCLMIYCETCVAQYYTLEQNFENVLCLSWFEGLFGRITIFTIFQTLFPQLILIARGVNVKENVLLNWGGREKKNKRGNTYIQVSEQKLYIVAIETKETYIKRRVGD